MHVLQSPPDAVVAIDGREYLYFVGTGYLCLQNHPEVIKAACLATERYGIHAATSRAGFGNSPPVLEAERRAAELFDAPAAFYFAVGYAGAAILLAALEEDYDLLLADELSHYSVLEAARGSRRPLLTFRHRDPADLASVLRKNIAPGQRPLLLTDGVFSVRGTIAPLPEYRAALGRYAGSGMLIDDAHGVGVLGQNGRGTLEHFGLGLNASTNSPLPLGEGPGVRALEMSEKSRPRPSPLPKGEGADFIPMAKGAGVLTFLAATASKAIGGFGGLVPGSREFVERARRSSHWFDGSSSPPVSAAAATAKAIEILIADADRRARLHANVRKLKDGLRGLGLEIDDSPVPIVCLTLGAADNMRRIQNEMMRRGIAIAYIPAYSGLGPEGGLRIAVFAAHTDAMIERLIDELRRVI
ncbi:MAG: pyridoxal phosphate-dependent aminotransferase family protein [Pirellulales bacterium]|nr:pyridoxal phosphate-dependent aminotransferase family protein [Pirellulales bacterium]